VEVIAMADASHGLAPATAPDLFEPVIGYRQWRLRDGALWSPFADMRWQRGVNTARCARGPAHAGPAHVEPAPASGCACGIYAWYRPCPRLASAGSPELAAGAVALWGAIELHATGMRAEHAMIVALALPLTRGRKRRRLVEAARALEVPVVPARRLARAALACGRAVGPPLVPPRAPGTVTI
jgi:hypothetical protein